MSIALLCRLGKPFESRRHILGDAFPPNTQQVPEVILRFGVACGRGDCLYMGGHRQHCLWQG